MNYMGGRDLLKDFNINNVFFVVLKYNWYYLLG